MGRCIYTNGAGGETCQNVSRPGACAEGGVYYDYGDCPTCFFVTELTSHVIAESKGNLVLEVAAQPSVMVAYDFRDVILRQSALGREVVELYAAHAKHAVEVLRKHPRLLLRALQLVTRGVLLAQDILRDYSLRAHGAGSRGMKLDPETVREMLEVSGELRKLSPKEFDQPVSRIEAIFKQIDGMTSTQILEHLAPEKHRK